MMTVRNQQDARIAFEMLKLYESMTPLAGMEEKRAAHVAALKREVRAFLRRQSERDADRRIVKDNGMDGFVLLMRLPASLRTVEEATEYFEEYEVQECAPSIYDCTGQAFTSWYKIFERRGQLWAYHSIAFDV